MADLEVVDVVKAFGGVDVLRQVSLHVRDGEFFTLLGPSGCGKSTLLAIVAGLETPDSGRVRAGDRLFVDPATRTFVPPERRELGLVFQSYALWPHLTVTQNVNLPLRLHRVGKRERADRIREALELVGISDLAGRYPHELSGGQQQRAALARTLAYRPGLLLLDEPLSNLDAKLRDQARVWLKELHERVGVTTVYVTHDQEEALALSTRIAVLDEGRVLQVADPETLYDRPATARVAAFIGRGTFLPATVAHSDGERLKLVLDPGPDPVVLEVRATTAHHPGAEVELLVRPEWVEILDDPESGATGHERRLDGKVVTRSYVGGTYDHVIDTVAGRIRARSAHRLAGGRCVVSLADRVFPVFERDGATPGVSGR